MHLYILTRGIKHEIDRFISDLQAQYFPLKRDDGKPYWVQLAVRPIQLWELVMPKESLGSVQKMIWSNNVKTGALREYPLFALRKALGAQKVPTFDEKLLQRPIWNTNIAVYPVGIREDRFDEKGNEAL